MLVKLQTKTENVMDIIRNKQMWLQLKQRLTIFTTIFHPPKSFSRCLSLCDRTLNCIQVKFVELILPVAKIVACRWGIGIMLCRLTLFWERNKNCYKVFLVWLNHNQYVVDLNGICLKKGEVNRRYAIIRIISTNYELFFTRYSCFSYVCYAEDK